MFQVFKKKLNIILCSKVTVQFIKDILAYGLWWIAFDHNSIDGSSKPISYEFSNNTLKLNETTNEAFIHLHNQKKGVHSYEIPIGEENKTLFIWI